MEFEGAAETEQHRNLLSTGVQAGAVPTGGHEAVYGGLQPDLAGQRECREVQYHNQGVPPHSCATVTAVVLLGQESASA